MSLVGSAKPAIRAEQQVRRGSVKKPDIELSALPGEVVPTTATTTGIPVPTRTLRIWNGMMFLFHSALIAVTLGANTNLDLAIKVYKTNLTFVLNTNETNDLGMPRFELVPTYVESGTLPLTWLTAAFFAASAIAHLGNFTIWRGFYERNLAMCRVPSRFIEYFVSASIMILILAYNAGIREYMLLFCIFFLIATTMPYGYLTELIAEPETPDTWVRPLSVRLTPYWLGNIPQVAAWAAILISFYDQEYPDGEGGPPSFVYIIIWSQLAFFFSFGFVQLIQQCRPPKHYYQGEIMYQVLSLVAKGVLGSILIFQVLTLSSFNEIFE